MSSPTLVDDTNPAVQYAAGWIWDQLTAGEVDHTRHGAAIAGISAWLDFSGTSIAVVGTLEPSATSGQPTTMYSIDGVEVTTYTAPFTPSGDVRYNVTFFSKFDLSHGDHRINVTNLNGTSPNVFWLDYFLVNVTAPASTSTTTSSTTAASATVTGTSGVSADTTTSTHHGSHVGAIVGGVIGAVVLIALGLLAIFLWRRRRQSAQDVTPFVSEVSPTSPSLSTPTTTTLGPYGSASYEKSTEAETVSPSRDRTLSLPTTYPSTDIPASLRHTTVSDPASGAAPSHSPTAIPPATNSPTTASPATESPVADSASTVDGPPTTIYTTPTVLHEEVSRAPWYAPRQSQSRAQALLRTFAKRRDSGSAGPAARDVDSGLRLYDQATLPPPYTAD